MAASLAVVLAALSSCSSSSTKEASPATTVAIESSSTTSSAPPSTTTVVISTTVAPRPTTTAVASSPEGHAQALYAAWTRGDVAAAGQVAQPEAVSALFARQWQPSDGWSFAECTGAAGSVICTWQRPSGQQLLLRVQNRTGGQPITVSEVRFQP